MHVDDLTPATLSIVLSCSADETGHHVAWIDREGAFFLSRESPHGDDPLREHIEEHGAVRFETLAWGNGYVGPGAAADSDWCLKLHAWIRNAWAHWSERRGSCEYSDFDPGPAPC